MFRAGVSKQTSMEPSHPGPSAAYWSQMDLQAAWEVHSRLPYTTYGGYSGTMLHAAPITAYVHSIVDQAYVPGQLEQTLHVARLQHGWSASAALGRVMCTTLGHALYVTHALGHLWLTEQMHAGVAATCGIVLE